MGAQQIYHFYSILLRSISFFSQPLCLYDMPSSAYFLYHPQSVMFNFSRHLKHYSFSLISFTHQELFIVLFLSCSGMCPMSPQGRLSCHKTLLLMILELFPCPQPGTNVIISMCFFLSHSNAIYLQHYHF